MSSAQPSHFCNAVTHYRSIINHGYISHYFNKHYYNSHFFPQTWLHSSLFSTNMITISTFSMVTLPLFHNAPAPRSLFSGFSLSSLAALLRYLAVLNYSSLDRHNQLHLSLSCSDKLLITIYCILIILHTIPLHATIPVTHSVWRIIIQQQPQFMPLCLMYCFLFNSLNRVIVIK